jgi:hypothetical protein
MADMSPATDSSRFLDGNLVATATTAADGDWAKHAARVLLGCGEAALDALAKFDSPEVRLCHALGLWIEGDEGAAAAMLRHTDASPARDHLKSLLERDRLNVLAFLPASRTGPHAMFSAIERLDKFRVMPVWFGAGNDYGRENVVDADIRYFYSTRKIPDLFVCEMVEWHLLPRNLASAPFFKCGHTSDFDIHAQEVLPWLRLFDAILTLDHTEWDILRPAMPGKVVLNYPKVFTVADTESTHTTERPIDVLMSGTVFSDFHHDKNELIANLRDIPGLNCVLINGFVKFDEYEDLIAKSKLTLSYIRHSGTMPTRALESIALGTWSAIQDDSVLSLYVPDNSSLLPYRHGDWQNFKTTIQNFCVSYSERKHAYRVAASKTKSIITKEFSPRKVLSQYLRFCAALPAIQAAIGLRSHTTREAAAPTMQKRGCVTKGWLPAYGDEGVLREILDNNLSITAHRDDYAAANDQGREQIIEYARLNAAGKEDTDSLEGGFEAFEQAIEIEPRALAPRFNLVRSAFHFGSSKMRHRAQQLAEETIELSKRDGYLSFPIWDDILPYDFYPSHLNSQALCELRLSASGDDTKIDKSNTEEQILSLIIASLHFYLARHAGLDSEADQHFRAAIDLDPENVHFQIGYAEYLLASGTPSSDDPGALLKAAIGKRIWSPMLEQFRKNISGDHLPTERNAAASVLFFDIEEESARKSKYRLSRSHTMTGEPIFGVSALKNQRPELSIMIVGGGASASPKIAGSLKKFRDGIDDIEIIVVDTALDVRKSPAGFYADTYLSAPQTGGLAYSSIAIRDALEHVKGRYLVIVEPDTPSIDTVIDVLKLFNTDEQWQMDLLKPSSAALVITNFYYKKWPSREIMAVGINPDLLRRYNLPQTICMLQASNLALPLLTHQLRNVVEEFVVANADTNKINLMPNTTHLLDLELCVGTLEAKVLRVVSPDWVRFVSETLDNSEPYLIAAEFDGDIEPLTEPRRRDRGQEAHSQPLRHYVVAEIKPETAPHRFARSLFRKFLLDSNGNLKSVVRHTPDGGIALNLGICVAEYYHPHLQVKMRRPGFLGKFR